MTMQVLEILIYNGKTLEMINTPLESYLSSIAEKPYLIPGSSTCWRGYTGTWEIKEDKLYLVKFSGYSANLPQRKYWKVGTDFIFPNQKEVFAEWYTGELQIPIGKEIKYQGYDYPICETDLFLKIKDGYVIGQRTVDNVKMEAEKKKEMEIELANKRKSILFRIKEIFLGDKLTYRYTYNENEPKM